LIETATILLIVACIAAGVVSAIVTTWSLRAFAYSLDTRLSIVEGTLTREVKARAGQERWKKPNRDEEIASAILAQQKPQPAGNWWDGAVGKKGAYVP
jgi:hypothetical protein